MYIFKAILFIIATIYLLRAIIQNKTDKAFDYLYTSIIMYAMVFLIKEV